MDEHRSIAKRMGQYAFFYRKMFSACLEQDMLLGPTANGHYLLCAVRDGKGTLRLNGSRFDVRSGDLFVIEPESMIQVEIRQKLSVYALFFRCLENPAASRRNAQEKRTFPLTGALHLNRTSSIMSRMDDLYRARDSHNGPQYLQRQNIRLSEMFYDITKELLDAAHTDPERAIGHTVDFMQEHYNEEIRIHQLARMAGYSPSAYARIFHKIVGMKPSEYLTALRIDHAKRLLLQSNDPVRTVAHTVGFHDGLHFSKVFKKMTGVSPTVYIKNKQRRVAVLSLMGFDQQLVSMGVQPVFALHMPIREPGEWDRILWKIKRARPDIIIADLFFEVAADRLQTIAPTAILQYHPDWTVNYAHLAALVDRERQAESVKNETFHTIAEIRHSIVKTAGHPVVSVIVVNPDRIRIQGQVDHAVNTLLYDRLGLRPPDIVPGHHMRIEITVDHIDRLRTDIAFLQINAMKPDSDKHYERICSSQVWLDHSMVRQGRVSRVDNWLSRSWGPYGQLLISRMVLSEIRKML